MKLIRKLIRKNKELIRKNFMFPSNQCFTFGAYK